MPALLLKRGYGKIRIMWKKDVSIYMQRGITDKKIPHFHLKIRLIGKLFLSV